MTRNTETTKEQLSILTENPTHFNSKRNHKFQRQTIVWEFYNAGNSLQLSLSFKKLTEQPNRKNRQLFKNNELELYQMK